MYFPSLRRVGAMTCILLLAAAFFGCAQPNPAANASITAPSITAAASAAPSSASSAMPAASAASLTGPDQAGVLQLLGVGQEALRGFTNVDLDGDGVLDAVALYRKADSGGDASYTTQLTLAAVNGADTHKVSTLPLAFEDGLHTDSVSLTVLPAGKDGVLSWYAVAGGLYGGTVDHVGYSVAKWEPAGWTDIFAKYRDTGMAYTLTMQDGPKAMLTLENGTAYPLEPSDLSTYQDSGWIDQNGKLTSSAHVFEEHTGFSALAPSVADGMLTLSGTQEIRGLHKLDVLATLNTTWKFDGANWSTTVDMEPVVG